MLWWRLREISYIISLLPLLFSEVVLSFLYQQVRFPDFYELGKYILPGKYCFIKGRINSLLICSQSRWGQISTNHKGKSWGFISMLSFDPVHLSSCYGHSELGSYTQSDTRFLRTPSTLRGISVRSYLIAREYLKSRVLTPGIYPFVVGHFEFIFKESIILKQLHVLYVLYVTLITNWNVADYLV